MSTKREYITTIATLNEIFVESKWEKLVITKCLKGKDMCIDLRYHQLYPNAREYCRTQKGIFMLERDMKDKLLPYLNSLYGSVDNSPQNGTSVDK